MLHHPLKSKCNNDGLIECFRFTHSIASLPHLREDNKFTRWNPSYKQPTQHSSKGESETKTAESETSTGTWQYVRNSQRVEEKENQNRVKIQGL
jgi:hypothetical protein